VLRFLVLIGGRTKLDLTISDLDDQHSYVVAANHRSAIDPFTIGGGFSFAIYRKLKPFRFFAHNFFFNRWWMYPFLVIFGCFPARFDENSKLETGLPLAEKLLQKGQTIFIFPEGKRVAPGEGEARPGVAVLAAVKSVQIIPAKIEWRGVWLFRRSSVIIGKPFSAAGQSPQEILDRVYALS
jgi:1-acyl-sn-glycerol-3-phosphate acyltransferase